MGKAAQSPRERELPWWASPAGLNLGFLIPIMLLVTYVGHSNFRGLTLRGVWFFTAKYVVLGIAVLLVTSLSCWIGAQITGNRKPNQVETKEYWDRAALVVGFIALVAYLYFFRPLLLDPVLLFRTITGAYRPDRN